jgi:hypothetical protein
MNITTWLQRQWKERRALTIGAAALVSLSTYICCGLALPKQSQPAPTTTPHDVATPTTTPPPIPTNTATAIPTETPLPTATRRPTWTPRPTYTPGPTLTRAPLPTDTPAPPVEATPVPPTQPPATIAPTAPPTVAPTEPPPPPPTDTPAPARDYLAAGVWRCPGDTTGAAYVGSSQSDKFHYLNCRWAKEIHDENRLCFESRDAAVNYGYIACGVCKP